MSHFRAQLGMLRKDAQAARSEALDRVAQSVLLLEELEGEAGHRIDLIERVKKLIAKAEADVVRADDVVRRATRLLCGGRSRYGRD